MRNPHPLRILRSRWRGLFPAVGGQSRAGFIEALEQRIAPASLALNAAHAPAEDGLPLPPPATFVNLPSPTPETPGVAFPVSNGGAGGTVLAFLDVPFSDSAQPIPFATGVLRSFVVDRDPTAGVALDFYYQLVNTSPGPDPFGDADFYRMKTLGGFASAGAISVGQTTTLTGLAGGTSGFNIGNYAQGSSLQAAATADRDVGSFGSVGFDFPTQPPLPFTGDPNDVNAGESSAFLVVRTNATSFRTIQMSVEGSSSSVAATFAPTTIYTWDTGGGADTSWFTAANWSPDGVPGAGDTAILDTARTITLSGTNATVANFTQNDGVLTGAATLTVTGTFSFGKGTQSGTGSTVVNAGGAFAFTDLGAGDAKTLDTRTLSLLGSGSVVSGTDDFTLNNGAQFLIGGSFATGNLFDFLHTTGAAGTVRINPGGTLTINDASDIAAGVSLDVRGTVSFPNVSGALNVQGGSTFAPSTIALTGALTNLRLQSDALFAGNTTVSGAGTLHTASGITTIPADSTLTGTGSATYALAGGTLTGGGAVNFSGRFDWGNGALRNLLATFNGAPSFVSGSVPNVLDNVQLNFGGGVVDSSAGVVLQNGAAINIGAGYEIRSGHDFTAGTGGGFLNVLAGGTLSNNVGTDVNIIGPGVVLNNNGTVAANSGNIDIRGGSTGSGGTWSAIFGTKILFNTGTHTLGGTTTFAGSAGGEIQVLNGVTVNLTGPATIAGGALLRLAGGAIANSAAFTVAANGALAGVGSFSGSVANSGTVQPGGTGAAGTLTVGSFTQTAGGTLAAELGGTGAGQFDVLNVSGAATLGGTLNITHIAGFTPIAGQTFRVVPSANNPGTFAALTGATTGKTQTPDATGLVLAQAALTYIWDAGAGADTGWFTAANWSPDGVPGAGDTAILNTNAAINLPNITNADIGTFQQSAGTLGGGGTLTVLTSFAWSGGTQDGAGTTTLASGGTLTLSGAAKTLNRGLINGGTAAWTGSAISGTGAFTNNGTFNASAGATFSPAFANSTTATFNQLSAADLFLGNFSNAGVVNVNGGSLVFSSAGAVTHTGPFTVSAGATLRFDGGTHSLGGAPIAGSGNVGFGVATVTFDAGSNYNVAGTTSISGGTVTFNQTTNSVFGTLNQSGGTLTGVNSFTVNTAMNWSGGTLSGAGTTTLATGATLTLSGGAKTLDRQFFADGPVNATGGSVSGGSLFTNRNNFIASASSSFGAPFTNAAAGTFTQSAGTTTFTGSFSNSGAINVNAGTLALNGGFSQGTGFLSLAGGAVSTTGTLNFNGGGELRGIGTITGNVDVSNGTVRPGGTGVLGTIAIAGNYTQGTFGTLAVELFGTGAGQFDVLNVSGTTTLDGTLNIAHLAGFSPLAGNSFRVVQSANDPTTFTTLTGQTTGIAQTANATGLTIARNAVVFTWDAGGGADESWFNPLNWDQDNGFPTASDTAILGIGTTFRLNGSASVGTLTQTTGIFTGGPLTVLNAFNWTGGFQTDGTTNLAAGSISAISSAGQKSLINHRLTNAGTLTWSGAGNIDIRAGAAAIANQGGGLFDIQTDADITDTDGGTGTLAITNAGVWRKSGGAGTTSIGNNNGTFTNTGTVEAQTGTLDFTLPATSTAGTWNAANGTTILFNSTPSLGNGSIFTGAGVVRLLNGASVNGTLTTANLELNGGSWSGSATIAGTLKWLNGALDGGGTLTIANGSTLALVNSSFVSIFNHTLSNAGTVTMSGTGNLDARDGVAAINNQAGGVFDFQTDADIIDTGGLPGTLAITNAGTWRKSGGAGTTSIDNNNGAFTNTGTVEVQTGTLSFGLGFTQTAGTTLLSGGNLGGGITFAFQGGELRGAGTITGNVNNPGATLRPGGTGAAGTLTVTGAYTQGAGGTLATELGGTGAGQFDVLSTGAGSTLDGTLNIAHLAGFTPSGGNSFRVVQSVNNPTTFTTLAGQTAGKSQTADATGLLITQNALVYVWDNSAGSGDWFNPLNWDRDSGVPGAGDTAILNIASTISPTGPVSVGTFQQSNGTVVGLVGQRITVVNAYNWTGGTMGNFMLLAGGSVSTFGGSADKTISSAILSTDTGSTVQWSGTGNLVGIIGGGVSNGGTFIAQNSATLTRGDGSTVVFVNQTGGVFTKSGTGTTTINNAVTFTNSGTVNVNDPAATIDFGTLTTTNGAVFNGPGASRAVGNFNVAGTNTITGGAGLELAGGTLTGTVTFAGAGNFNWTSGTVGGAVTIANGSTALIAGSADKTLSTFSLNIQSGATVQWSGVGNIVGTISSAINNSGTFLAQNSASIVRGDGSAPVFNNSAGGVFTKTGTGVTTVSNAVAFNNAGTVNVNNAAATIDFGALTSNAGIFNGPGVSRIAGTFGVSGTTTITGGPALELAAGRLSGTGTFAGAGNFHWTGGTIGGSTTIASGHTALIDGAAAKTLDLASLTIASGATAQWSGTGDLLLTQSAAIANSGTFLVQNSASIARADGTTPAFDNLAGGTFAKTAGAGTTTFTGLNVANAGTIDAQIGTLNFASGYTQSAGATLLGGGAITVGAPMILNGGELRGAGTITGSVNNTGATVRPGGTLAAGTIIIEAYTQGAGGTLAVELGGTGAGQFDVVNVTGPAALGGTLNLTHINAFTPANGNTFRVVQSVVNPGTFATLSGASAGKTQTASATGLVLAQGPLNVFTWDAGAGADTSWFTAANWSPDGVPGAGDTAILDTNATITLSSANRTVATFSQSAGTLTGTATLTTTTFVWSGGVQGNFGTTIATSTLNLANTGGLTLGTGGNTARTLISNGVATLSGGNLLISTSGGGFSGSSFINNGTFNVADDADIAVNNLGGSPGSFFNPAIGIFNKSGAGTTTTFAPALNSAGTINLNSGTLVVSGAATIDGTVAVSAGTTLRAANNFFVNAAATLSGAGTFEVAGGNADFQSYALTGAVLLQGGSLNFNTLSRTLPTLTQSGGTLSGSGTITVTGALTWSGGTQSGVGTTIANGPLDLTNVGGLNLGLGGSSRRTLINNNVATLSGGNLLFATLSSSPASQLVNNGTFNVTDGADITLVNFGGPAPLFTNAAGATFNKSGAGLVTTFNVPLSNAGTVNVNSGTLEVGGDATITGTLAVGAGATLRVAFGNLSVAAGATLSGAGTLEVTSGSTANLQSYALTGTVVQTGGTLNFNALNPTLASLTQSGGLLTGSGTIAVTGALMWSSGLQGGAGTTVANGTLDLPLTGFPTLGDGGNTGRTLINNGVATLSGTANLNLSTSGGAAPGAQIINNGTFNATNNVDIVVSALGGSAPSFTNAAGGTFNKSGGGTVTTIGVPATNAGTINVNGSGLDFTGTFTQSGGATVLAGGGGISTSSVLMFNGGELRGVGTISGSVNNTGATVRPGGTGAAGTLAITSTYTQSAGGTLAAELGGTGAGAFDVLNVTGAVTLGGTLNIAHLGAFTPASGNTFRVVQSAGNPGTFATLSGASAGKTQTADATGLVLAQQVVTGLTYIWDAGAGADTSFFNPLNWDRDASFPGAADTAVLQTNATINLPSSTSVAVFQQSNGTFTSPTGVTFTVLNSFDWSGGVQSGAGTAATTVPAGSSGVLSGAALKTLAGRALNVGGSLGWTGAGNFALNQGTLTVQSGGSFNIQSEALLGDADGNGTVATIVVAGLLRKIAGTGTSALGGNLGSGGGFVTVLVNATGTVRADIGTLQFDGPVNNAGVVDAAANTILFASSQGTSSGRFNADLNGAVRITGGVQTLAAGASITGAGDFDIANGRVDVAPLASVNATNVSLSGTSGLLGISGALTVTQSFDWTGGTIGGGASLTLAAGSVSTMSGTEFKMFSSGTINLAGTLAWTGTGSLLGTGGGQLIVAQGGLFDLQSNAAFATGAFGGFNTSLIINGTLRKSAGAGVSRIDGSNGTVSTSVNATGRVEVQSGTLTFGDNFANNGTVSALAGTLEIAADVGSDNGTFNAATGARVLFNGSARTLDPGAALTGAGLFEITNGGLVLNTNISVQSLALHTVVVGIDGPGNLTVTSRLDWTGGAMIGTGKTTLPALSVSTMSGTTDKTLARDLDLFGTLSVNNSGSGIFAVNSNTLRVGTGGLLNLNAAFIGDNNSGTPGLLVIDGTLRKIGLNDTASIGGRTAGTGSMNITINPGGRVEVAGGPLDFRGSGVNTSAGVFDVAAAGNTSLIFNAPFTLNTGAALTGAGTSVIGNVTLTVAAVVSASGTLRLATGTLALAAPLTQTGTFDWVGGTISGASTATLAGLAITTALAKTLDNAALALNGAGVWNSTGALTLARGANFSIGLAGVLDFQSAATINAGAAPAPTLSNAGLLKMTSNGTAAIGVTFTNSGTVSAEAGTLQFNSGFTQNGGATNLAGGNLGGTLLDFGAGVLSGAGTITGNVSNTGATVRPGGTNAAGTLNVSGDFTQTIGGTLAVEVGGAGAAQFDRLAISGAATLGGALTASRINGFTPASGAQFQVLTASPRIATFANVTGPFTAQYNVNNVAFIATGAPPPVFTWDAGAGADTSWFNPLNWDRDSGFPGATDTAILQINATTTLPTSTGVGTLIHNVGTSAGDNSIFTIPTGITLTVLNNFTWTGGTENGAGTLTVAAGATFTYPDGSPTFLTQRTLNLLGNTTFSNASQETLMLASGATINNSGVLEIRNDLRLLGSGTLNNLAGGTIRGSTASTFLVVSPFLSFNNAGLVRAEAGTLGFNGIHLQTAGVSEMAGGILSSFGGFRLQGGVLQGTGTFAGNIDNIGGIVRPGGAGAIGTLSASGSYNQSAGGTLEVDLAGTAAGQFDVFAPAGFAVLGGTLAAPLLGGFTPAAGNQFRVLAAGNAVTGTFATTPAGFTTQYNATSVTLLVPTGASPFVVTTTLDAVNANDGVVSLREAIVSANGTAGVDTITFNIAGAGVKTITVSTALPALTEAAIIDGYTQPGSSANTLATGNNAVLNIVLAGASNTLGNGLTLSAGGVTVRGLMVQNFTDGIAVNGANAVIAGNWIGVSAAGTAAAGNADDGIQIGASNVTIGGTTPAARNVISGNSGGGIEMTGGFSGLNVQGNYIGTNAAGSAALGNAGDGIQLQQGAANNTIGGTTAAARNVISGNLSRGLLIFSDGNVVQGNLIGTNAGGLAAVPNRFDGLTIAAPGSNNLIGGAAGGARNVISGNDISGVSIESLGSVTGFATGNRVQGNFIGVGADGTTPLGNRAGSQLGWGVVILRQANDNLIGGTGPGEANLIANNAGPGIAVIAGAPAGNRLTGNTIFANGGLGIDLGAPGPDANDAGDADTGPNGLLNHPTLTSVTRTSIAGGFSYSVSGTYSGAASTALTIDVYANTAADASGFGEGDAYLGSVAITTDAAGQATFTRTFTTGATGNFGRALGEIVSATATLVNGTTGATSEFSNALAPVLGPGVSILDTAVVEGEAGTSVAVFRVRLSEAAPSPISVHFSTHDLTTPGAATAGSDYDAQSGDLQFAIGEIEKTISVVVRGDLTPEARERFGITLSAATAAHIADAEGVGAILDDDHHLFFAAQGSGSRVEIRNAEDGALVTGFYAFAPGFTGGVRVASGDVNGDGFNDVIVGTGDGGGARVRVFDGHNVNANGRPLKLHDFYAYGNGYRGGVFVAAGDVNGDGRADIIVSPSAGSSNKVKVFSGAEGTLHSSFLAFGRGAGGVRIAAGDVNGDGYADIIAGSGAGASVRVFDGAKMGEILKSFRAFPRSHQAGLTVASGDVDGDGLDDVIVGAGRGSSTARIFLSGKDDGPLEFLAFGDSTRGINVGAVDVNSDGIADIIAAQARNAAPRIRIFNGSSVLSGTPRASVSVGAFDFDPAFAGGVYVG